MRLLAWICDTCSVREPIDPNDINASDGDSEPCTADGCDGSVTLTDTVHPNGDPVGVGYGPCGAL